MTVLKNMGAVSTPMNWDFMNWDNVHSEVMKLQVRIAKATKEGRWNKVKCLQWLLTHSFSAKCIAVQRITTNRGKKTPGVDGVLLNKDEEKYHMVHSLSRRNYKAQPLRRIYIPKSGGGNKKRPLGIPTMLDRAMQALYTLALLPVSETTADLHSYGFRPERSTADAIERIFLGSSHRFDPQWILEGDIKGCFDNIDHQWILDNVVMDKVILRKWLKAGYLEKMDLFPTERGTPQGGIISPCLANLVLDGMEAALDKEFGSGSNISGRIKFHASKLIRLNGVKLCRYADDFVVTGASRELLEQKVKPSN
jgi:RNA-directed DNA polymerase